MRQVIREKVFETNSSSIHALTVEKYSEFNIDFSDLYMEIKPFRDRELKYFGNEFTSIEDKLRYLWTIRCLYDNSAIKHDDTSYDSNLDYDPWEEREWVDEFTSMLRSIFPNVNFIETDVDYLEDYEYLKDNPLMLDEKFIKNLIANGRIAFTIRDYSDWQEEAFIDDLRKDKQKYITAWSEG